MTTKPKAKTGRPPEAVPEDIAEQLSEWIAHGKTLREFCRQEGKPAWRTVYDWMIKDKEFSARIAHARDLGYDAIAEETLAIIDEPPPSDMNGKTDNGYVVWSKNRVEQRMKLLAKWSPKKYGDKVGIEHSGSVALDAAILEARKRVKQSD
jgi:hypothetical protein